MIFVDPREKRPAIIALHNGPVDAGGKRPLLVYRRDDNPDAAYSYDVRFEWGDRSLRGEVKQRGDAIACWHSGVLDRQLEAVDFFLVETDPFMVAADTPDDKDAAAVYRRNCDNFEKHLALLSLRMPVIRTTSVRQTAEVLKHIDATEGGIIVRGNSVRGRSEDPRMGMWAALPGINPYRFIDKPGHPLHGMSVGDAIWSLIDTEEFRQSICLPFWQKIPGIGPAAIAKVEGALFGHRPSP